MITDFKLSNVLLRVDDHAAAHPELYFRAEAGAVRFDERTGVLQLTGKADFLTYLNACSACKWRQYAQINRIRLRVEAVGRGRIAVSSVAAGKDAPTVLEEYSMSSLTPTTLDIEVDATGQDLIGFIAIPHAGSHLGLIRAYYYVQIDAAAVNPVRLALATTTFKKEDFILPNIAKVRAGIAAEGGAMAEGFHMFVVDNGRTLDAAALTDDVVTVLPNPNVGGSGGFARGMIAATDEPGRFTHVLLMDDDVNILPESLIRTFNLLSLAKGRYRDAFVNGAMLSLEDPARQFEDVARIDKSGLWPKVKPDLDLTRVSDLLVNERTSVEVPNAYGAWWFSCIPVRAIEEHGLPLPFFVRSDDMEFGVRNHPVYMTMDGICVWHASFEGRFRASVDCYQQVRNFLVMIAVDDAADEKVYLMRVRRQIRRFLRDLGYGYAEQLLDGLEDYLRGPEFLEHADGAQLMLEHGERNDKPVPVGEIDPELLREAGVTPEVLARPLMLVQPSTPLQKLWRTIPYDKNYLPAFTLGKRPGYVVDYGSATIEGSSLRRRTLVVLDPTRATAEVRHLDQRRFWAIRQRERELMRAWKRDGKRVRRAWKDAMPYLTSRLFWGRKLGLK